ncbi:class I SAM-dependent methyltransferase [Roseofilum reptotaenium CS-1145]|uniref:Methyltransferase n=1 Tax=Roseofilum reptotaenium AO1-A TaxID=1925591 RepID=A0A1L9QKP6_9CYAN|nr:class I SAM-dependent methyltransferase [Roseofilum reptotaenium]MDB9517032.1 class I SAM-dependent methyltransferase [Roseofilum reptotaenium CS-1145]OJJ17385.1 methyltransferase [Roseofilum reptotaenium AO1-A]
MQDSKQNINARASMDLEQRKNWYSPVANIYYNARPSYPNELIDRAVSLAQLSSDSSILEVGCGPGNATVAFAKFGCSMTCLEPNLDFCLLAERNCVSYPNVTIYSTTFEAWERQAKQFNAVLSANAFHWIPSEIRYAKAAAALRDNGCLILLWNLTPEPKYEVYQAIEKVYQAYAPSLVRYEGPEVQADILRRFEQEILNSGFFKELVVEQTTCEVTYSIDDYFKLLSTLRRLEPQVKELLFARLRKELEKFGDSVQLSFLSAVHVARKEG